MFTVTRFVEKTAVGVFAPASQKPRRNVFSRQDSNRVVATSFATTDRSSEGDTDSQKEPLYRNAPYRSVLSQNEESQGCRKRRGFEA